MFAKGELASEEFVQFVEFEVIVADYVVSIKGECEETRRYKEVQRFALR